MESVFLTKNQTKLEKTLRRFEKMVSSDGFPLDDNTDALIFLYLHTNRLNLHFLQGDFKQGEPLVHEILNGLMTFKDRIDAHHIMVLYYKIACLYFGMGDNKKCILYLQKIIHNKSLKMREDLLCFSRVLSLVAHYEAGMDYHLETQLKETYKFLIKMDDLHEVQREMIKFLKNLGEIYPHQIKGEFKKLYNRLKELENHPYEKRAFLYLDILSWLESKIQEKPVSMIIMEKAKTLTR